jgi:hypothetical protein
MIRNLTTKMMATSESAKPSRYLAWQFDIFSTYHDDIARFSIGRAFRCAQSIQAYFIRFASLEIDLLSIHCTGHGPLWA